MEEDIKEMERNQEMEAMQGTCEADAIKTCMVWSPNVCISRRTLEVGT